MKNILNKSGLAAFFLLVLIACGSGGSDSGGGEDTTPGDGIPTNFIGTYKGLLNLEASAAGITERDSVEITITVNSDGTIRFDGDDPDETFTVGVTNAGEFSGSLPINQEGCVGTVSVSGRVDGTTASGTLQGAGKCKVSGLDLDVTLRGDFTAIKT